MGATQLLAHRYSAAHPQRTAKLLQESPPDVIAVFLAEVEPAVAAAVLRTMRSESAARTLEHLTLAQTLPIVKQLDLTALGLILRQGTDEVRHSIIGALPKSLARRVRDALAFRPGTVGSVVDSTVTALDAEASVKEARAHGLDARLPYLYVVNPEHRLVGVIHRRDLEHADERALLKSIMRDRVQSVPADASLSNLANHSAWSALDALPVVGTSGTFLGVVRHKSLRKPPRAQFSPPGSQTAVTALLDLGEVYWSGLFSAIETLSSTGSDSDRGGPR